MARAAHWDLVSGIWSLDLFMGRISWSGFLFQGKSEWISNAFRENRAKTSGGTQGSQVRRCEASAMFG